MCKQTALEKAQAVLSEAEVRWKAVDDERRELDAVIAEKTKPVNDQIHATFTEISRLRSEVRRLEDHKEALYEEKSEIRAEFSEELDVIGKKQNAAFSAEVEARTAVSVAYFDLAQAALADADCIGPREMSAELDQRIKSRRQFSYSGTLGAAVVDVLSSSHVQRSGGFTRSDLGQVHVRDANGVRVHLSERQKERCWKYLTVVCVVRGDDGLAPPFKKELNDGSDSR